MNTNISDVPARLCLFRNELKRRGVDAFIVPGNDPHFSEYPASHWKLRRWLSGFTGSAGVLAVTANKAALWVDSRYFIQARQQLEGSGIEMQKAAPGRFIDENWLRSALPTGATVGVDAQLFSVSRFRQLEKALSPLWLKDTGDVFDAIYTDRPALPDAKIFLLPDTITGKSRRDKLAAIGDGVVSIITALDDIAWTLNLRGADISCNPVAISYLVINNHKAHLFINSDKISDECYDILTDDDVELYPYSEFYNYIAIIARHKTVKINPDKVNYRIYTQLLKSGAKIVEDTDIRNTPEYLKSIKNDVELDGFRKCMITDGVAMLRFIEWLGENVGKTRVTELSAAAKLEEFRKQGSEYMGLSFATISAYGANAALPHYSPSPLTDAEIKTDAFYLVDSGAQYLTGTTDLTRTLHFGKPTPDEMRNYTLVLKGMISLSRAIFPAGARGSQLDLLARQFLWADGKNFLHGTGHGVGHFLCVHEGPQSIRSEENPTPFAPGMVTSNEPAIYLENRYGIRIENLLVCKHHCTTDFGDFYAFETLTLCPVDVKPVDFSLLTDDEAKWLHDYNRHVYSVLAPYI
jgi:Xaa-Pro aminopeptidase